MVNARLRVQVIHKNNLVNKHVEGFWEFSLDASSNLAVSTKKSSNPSRLGLFFIHYYLLLF